MVVRSGRSAGSSAQQRCISCRSSSSGNTTFSQQGRSCSLKKMAISSRGSSSGNTTFSQQGRSCSLKKMAISSRGSSSGNTTFSQQGRSCSLKKDSYQLWQLLLREHHFLTTGPQLLPKKWLSAVAAPPQGAPLSHSTIAAAPLSRVANSSHSSENTPFLQQAAAAP